ncbi:GDCCVxC domain-containing (seleno)protein [Paraburkholderia sp. GAS348]|uniref:GDCCVxC domain-containing (seleno)protein n=1 Tax=Paraburkholderia sp. GAS348 TaxID=3035132 RepID=UPI003D209289
MFRSSTFPVQVTGRFLSAHFLNASDARHVDQGVVSSETEYFEVGRGHCKAVLKPKPGVCCVYCSYRASRCPPR